MAPSLSLAALTALPLGVAALTVEHPEEPALDFSCRARLPDGSWGPCGSAEAGAQLLRDPRAAAPAAAERPPPVELLPQEELDVATTGSWENVGSNEELPPSSLGSLSRYATCSLYLGPKGNLGAQEGGAEGVLRTPHSVQHAGHADRSRCHEYRFVSDANQNASLHQYSWATQEHAQQCTRGRWIAFWGDSTTRIAFSAMVDFLAGGIQSPRFPTHDWSFDRHQHLDKCNEAEEAESGMRCHLAARIRPSDTTLTFNFVTRMGVWPNLKETLAAFRNTEEFPSLQLDEAPDILLVNSGPWEMYKGGGWPGYIGDHAYAELFANWLEHDFGDLVKERGQSSPRLIMLGNTACPETGALACRVRNRTEIPCTAAMWNLAALQRRILGERASALGLGDSVRWVDSRSLYDPLPEGYSCRDGGFHLPSVVTDARVNHVLHAACGR